MRKNKLFVVLMAVIVMLASCDLAMSEIPVTDIGIFDGSSTDNTPPSHEHVWRTEPMKYMLEGTDKIMAVYSCSGCSEVRKDVVDGVIFVSEENIDTINSWEKAKFAVGPDNAQVVLNKIESGSTVFLLEGEYGKTTLANSDMSSSSPKQLSGVAIIGLDGAKFDTDENGYVFNFGSNNNGVSIEASGEYSYGVLLKNITFKGEGICFEIGRGSTNIYHDIVVDGCTFEAKIESDKRSGFGIRMYCQDRGSDVVFSNLTLKDSKFTGYGNSAIYIKSITDLTCEGNTMIDCNLGFNLHSGIIKGKFVFRENINGDCQAYTADGGNAWALQSLSDAEILIEGNKIYNHDGSTLVYAANISSNVTITTKDNYYYDNEVAMTSGQGVKLAEVENEDLSNTKSYPNNWGLIKDGSVHSPAAN